MQGSGHTWLCPTCPTSADAYVTLGKPDLQHIQNSHFFFVSPYSQFKIFLCNLVTHKPMVDGQNICEWLINSIQFNKFLCHSLCLRLLPDPLSSIVRGWLCQTRDGDIELILQTKYFFDIQSMIQCAGRGRDEQTWNIHNIVRTHNHDWGSPNEVKWDDTNNPLKKTT